MTDHDHERIFRDLSRVMFEQLPGFDIRWKDQGPGSALQKAIGLLLRPSSPGYLTDHASSWFGRVYFPSITWVIEDPERAWRVLAREFVRLHDQKLHPWWFRISYLFPQILAPLALISLGAGAWAPLGAALGFLAFLLPLPSPWRRQWELRAHEATVAACYWTGAEGYSVMEACSQAIASGYYGAETEPSRVYRDLDQLLVALLAGARPALTPEDTPLRLTRLVLLKARALVPGR